MPLDAWDTDQDQAKPIGSFERAFWLIAARVLIPVNALVIGYLVGQAF